jgi:hypothetical protein
LQDARCIAVGFAVTHQQNRHVASLAAFMGCGEAGRKAEVCTILTTPAI